MDEPFEARPAPQDEQILSLFNDEKTKERGFRMLMDKYSRYVYSYTRRFVYSHEDANDLTQDVFVKIWRFLGSFRGDSSLKTWMTRIVITTCLSFLKKKKEALALGDDKFTDHLWNVAAQEHYFSADRLEQWLQEAIIRLPEKQRIVFTLRYYDELPYEEMSKALDTSVGALKASYHFAREKVEEYLKKKIN